MGLSGSLDTLRRECSAEAVFRLTLSYLGGAYAGWQRQPNALGIQQVVEEALAELTGEATRVHAASRTDAGVHARGQVAHVRVRPPFATRSLVEGTNHFLPPDVRVMDAMPAPPRFHARTWAVAKEYRYELSRNRVLSPFEAPTRVRVPSGRLDTELVRQASGLLEGRHDFSAFARSGGAHRQPVRRIFRAELRESGPRLTFRIVGDGFLRGMVRSLVGTLLWVGDGQMTLGRLEELLAGEERSAAGPSAPARGLHLVRVLYPEDRCRW